MKYLITFLACAALSLPALAQHVEAMKHGDAHAEAAAQATVQARAKIPLALAVQPEAERSFNARAAAVAEARKTHRLQDARHPADQSQALLQHQKL
jgi:hypothetical protein